ncbi:hypothetical protein [Nonomuraea sp. B5E05]|uniref:hypothetical protein n=1 Tax=Nonomuraea sp. B5E05 TaxID=3153569 RepID=UPI0032615D37
MTACSTSLAIAVSAAARIAGVTAIRVADDPERLPALVAECFARLQGVSTHD